jgi:hypothetical protein
MSDSGSGSSSPEKSHTQAGPSKRKGMLHIADSTRGEVGANMRRSTETTSAIEEGRCVFDVQSEKASKCNAGIESKASSILKCIYVLI